MTHTPNPGRPVANTSHCYDTCVAINEQLLTHCCQLQSSYWGLLGLSQMPLFCSGSHPGGHLHYLSSPALLGPLLTVTLSQTPLVSDHLDRAGPACCSMSFRMGLCDVFLMGTHALYRFWGTKTTDVMSSSCHRGKAYTTATTPHGWS